MIPRFGRLFGGPPTPASTTVSPISQTRGVTPAATAGMVRSTLYTGARTNGHGLDRQFQNSD